MPTSRALVRRVATITLAAAAGLAALTGCGSSEEPQAQSSANGNPAAPAGLPVDSSVVPVAVTKPAVLTPVDAGALPEKARLAAKFKGLTPDEQSCVDSTIAAYVQQDAGVAQANGRLAGLMGGAIVACMDPQRLGSVFADALAPAPLGGQPLTDVQHACLRDQLATQPDKAAQLIGSMLIYDVNSLLDAFEPFETACGFQLGP